MLENVRSLRLPKTTIKSHCLASSLFLKQS